MNRKSSTQNPAIVAERIVVNRDKISLTVALDAAAPHFMTPEYAARLVRRVPSLPHHACINPVGPLFGDVIGTTSVPHVLEHLIVDGQCAHCGAASDDFLFVGTTEWIDEAAGLAHIEVNYADDIDALRALRDGLAILNELFEGK